MSSHTHPTLDETTEFLPKFNSDGLITAVVSEAETGKPLMVAHMNQTALNLSLETGQAHFFSRSRQEIWHKGGTSGNFLQIVEITTDCDQDVLWIHAIPQGNKAACHTGRKSCFYRRLIKDNGSISLKITDSTRLFDPKKVYYG